MNIVDVGKVALDAALLLSTMLGFCLIKKEKILYPSLLSGVFFFVHSFLEEGRRIHAIGSSDSEDPDGEKCVLDGSSKHQPKKLVSNQAPEANPASSPQSSCSWSQGRGPGASL